MLCRWNVLRLHTNSFQLFYSTARNVQRFTILSWNLYLTVQLDLVGNSIPKARVGRSSSYRALHSEADLTNESFVWGKDRWYLELPSATRFIQRRLTRMLQTRRTMAIRTIGLHWYACGEKVDTACVVLRYFSWREVWAILKSSHTGKITYVVAWGIIRVKGNFIFTRRDFRSGAQEGDKNRIVVEVVESSDIMLLFGILLASFAT